MDGLDIKEAHNAFNTAINNYLDTDEQKAAFLFVLAHSLEVATTESDTSQKDTEWFDLLEYIREGDSNCVLLVTTRESAYITNIIENSFCSHMAPLREPIFIGIEATIISLLKMMSKDIHEGPSQGISPN